MKSLCAAAISATALVLFDPQHANALVYLPKGDDILKTCGGSVDEKQCAFFLNEDISLMKEGRLYWDHRACIPSGITYTHLRSVIVDYVTSHQEAREKGYQLAIGAALSEVYPCPPDQHYRFILRKLDNAVLNKGDLTADNDNAAIRSLVKSCDSIPECATMELYQRGDLLASLGGGPAMMAMFKEASTYNIILLDKNNDHLAAGDYEAYPDTIGVMSKLCLRIPQCEKAEAYQKDKLVFSKSRSEMSQFMRFLPPD